MGRTWKLEAGGVDIDAAVWSSDLPVRPTTRDDL